jgi:putative ABC transport system ATP-binding protein
MTVPATPPGPSSVTGRETTDAIYELSGVRRFFDKNGDVVRALDGVDLCIGQGEFLAVQGPTGHGKSTLLVLLGGLDRPTEGRVSFNGRDLGALREDELAPLRAKEFGFVFQTFHLIPTLTAQENVEAALAPLGLHAAEYRRRSAAALDELGLGGRGRHLPAELSGGEQQRVAIARALVKNPTVLLADEPTGNLDEDTRDEIVGLLERLWRERGLTLVLVTHETVIARRAQRVGVMTNGRLTIRRDSANHSGFYPDRLGRPDLPRSAAGQVRDTGSGGSR